MRTLLKCATLLLLSLCFLAPAPSSAQVAVSVRIGPPVLPVYTQPPCPEDGYIWTPGYWAYGADGYYWVPGVWVAPPRVGVCGRPATGVLTAGSTRGIRDIGDLTSVSTAALTTASAIPASASSAGTGWAALAYNTAVVNVNRTVVRNVYVNRTVINNTTVINNRASFNGEGGVMARPTTREESFEHERHFEPTSNQFSHEHAAAHDRNQFASANHGRPTTAAMDSVNGRRFNQQGRIANGISSGQLNGRETKNLEGREAHLNGEVRNDRSANGGRLTPQERQQVNRQQNNLSHSIYDDKHNGATAHYGNNEVGARRDEQQQRIANGVRSGQMTPSEAARAEHHEQNINRHIEADRSANGGRLTPQEHRNINEQQNAASHQIHNEKHNDRTEHGR